MQNPRRTQAERRDTTRAMVLACATRLFGEHGYATTSLEHIATEAGTTIRPIYHYFGNKQTLFEAVVEVEESKLLTVLRDASIPPGREGLLMRFRGCLAVLAEPGFQRVVLIDAPAVLGRGRWAVSPVAEAAGELLDALPLGRDAVQSELIRRMMIGALTEAALALAESKTATELEQRIDALMGMAASVLPG